jgi:hypothetical protein
MALIVFVALILLLSAIPIQASPTKPAKANISDDAAKLGVKDLLTKKGILVISVNVADGRSNGGTKSMIIAYESTSQNVSDLGLETGKILGAWFGAVESGWDCDELSVIIGDTNGKPKATEYCTKEWKDAYLRGNLTSNQIIVNVAGTVTKV